MFDDVDYDPAKSAINVAKHGISLGDFAGFDGDVTFIADERYDYGEHRVWAVGRIEGVGHVLVFTRRGETARLISLRRAHEKEMRRYGR